jgi:hypothetical protein
VIGSRLAHRPIARGLFREGLRQRRTLVIRGALPFLLLGVVGLATLLPQADRGDDRETFTLAVSGDLEGLREALDPLIASRLVLVPSDDPALDAALDADAGLALPDDLAAVEAGQPGEAVVYQRARSRASRAAAGLAATGLRTVNLRAMARQAPDVEVSDVLYDVLDVQRTREGASALYAQVVAGLVALQASVVVGAAAARAGGRRQSATLAALLLLPVRRERLVADLALADAGLGLVTAAPVLVLIGAGAALFAQFDQGTGAALLALVATLVAALALSWVMAVVGNLVGLRARSHEQASLASSIATVAVAVIAGLMALGERAVPALLDVVPVAGLVSALRAALTDPGAWTLGRVVFAATVTVVAGLLPLRWAARVAGEDRSGLRLG